MSLPGAAGGGEGGGGSTWSQQGVYKLGEMFSHLLVVERKRDHAGLVDVGIQTDSSIPGLVN